MPPFELDGRPVRSSDVRAAARRWATSRWRRGSWAGHTSSPATTTDAAGEGSVIAFELPVALPPDGEWPVDVEADGRHARGPWRRSPTGPCTSRDVPGGTRVRVTFLA